MCRRAINAAVPPAIRAINSAATGVVRARSPARGTDWVPTFAVVRTVLLVEGVAAWSGLSAAGVSGASGVSVAPGVLGVSVGGKSLLPCAEPPDPPDVRVLVMTDPCPCDGCKGNFRAVMALVARLDSVRLLPYLSRIPATPTGLVEGRRGFLTSRYIVLLCDIH